MIYSLYFQESDEKKNWAKLTRNDSMEKCLTLSIYLSKQRFFETDWLWFFLDPENSNGGDCHFDIWWCVLAGGRTAHQKKKHKGPEGLSVVYVA